MPDLVRVVQEAREGRTCTKEMHDCLKIGKETHTHLLKTQLYACILQLQKYAREYSKLTNEIRDALHQK